MGPDCEVRVFGSRVKGTPKPYADLDLVVVGRERLEHARLHQLVETFAESDLPFRVDVLDWVALAEDFRTLIEEQNEVIQKPAKIGHLAPLPSRS